MSQPDAGRGYRLPWLMVLSVVLLITRATDASVILYDRTSGTLPAAQGWTSVLGGSSTQSYQAGSQVLELNTTGARSDQSGYFSEEPFLGLFEHPGMMTLDRTTGFTVRFDLQVISEGHNARDDNNDGLDDRAGFSVIAISQDLRGLELGFFNDRVWAYADATEGPSSLFTQAEGAAFDTTADLVRYDLAVLNNSYTLYQNGSPLLTDGLRNYNPSGVPALADPYDNPSFLFFGDDTTSADSHVWLGNIELLDHPVIPEPGTMHLLVGSLLFVVGRRGRG